MFFNRQFLLVNIMAICTLAGCARHTSQMRIESSIKNAFIMYSREKQYLGKPSDDWFQFVDSDIGHEQFVEDLSHFVTTKYRVEAIYAIGWFGDDRHVPLIANRLKDSDPEVRRVALAAFSNLTKQAFVDNIQAQQWWDKNKTMYAQSQPVQGYRHEH